MIVIDPVITDTAKLADFHLRVRPGTDAWCLAALAAVLVQEELCDEEFLADTRQRRRRRARGARRRADRRLRAALRRRRGPAPRRGPPDRGARQACPSSRISASSRRPNSTLCSYLNKLLWILTGNFAKRGAQHLHSSFAPLFGAGGVGRTPVTGAPIIAGLVPSNVVPAGDPDRSPRPVPGDDRREQQPGALGRRLGRGARGAASRWSCSSSSTWP